MNSDPIITRGEPDLLHQAADLWARGFSVIPVHVAIDGVCSCGNPTCGSPGKHPSVKWEAYQTERATDDEVFERFGNGTRRNIGIVTGAISGVVAIDGDNSEALEWMGAHLPATAMRSRTAKGEHWFYRHPGVPVSNKARIDTGDPAVLIDVRGDGGFVVAPGSEHASGVTYERIGEWPAVDDLPVFDSEWLEVEQPKAKAATGPGKIREGQRNAGLTALAGRLRRASLDTEEITGALLEANRRRCETPLPEAEVRGIARSVGKYETDGSIGGNAPRVVELLDDVAILSRPEPDYLIAGRIVEGSHGMIYGPSGAGKSFIFIGASLAIASRTPWLDADVITPGPVVYVLTEAAKVKGRIRAAKQAAGLPLDKAVGFYLYPGVVNLSDADSVIRFVELVTPLRPRLVVFDTLSRCMSGDENNKSDTAVVVAHSDYVREKTGAALWWVHHTNASESRERGSTNLRASCDTVFALAKTDDLLTLTCEKQRDAEPFEPLRLRLVPVLETDSCAIRLADDMTPITTATVGPLTTTQAQALMVLQDIGGADGLTAGSWEAASPSIRHASLFRAIKVLLKRGVIRQNGQRYTAVRGVS
jgi:AAA domain/Bifunctional DNA primase/polymerase, N-terminal/Primase C terminal 1 (PriCT-1)